MQNTNIMLTKHILKTGQGDYLRTTVIQNFNVWDEDLIHDFCQDAFTVADSTANPIPETFICQCNRDA